MDIGISGFENAMHISDKIQLINVRLFSRVGRNFSEQPCTPQHFVGVVLGSRFITKPCGSIRSYQDGSRF